MALCSNLLLQEKNKATSLSCLTNISAFMIKIIILKFMVAEKSTNWASVNKILSIAIN